MASKNSVKEYVPQSYYHVYNRGVEKRDIFLDSQDYAVFLSYLQTYLAPKDDQALSTIINSYATTPSEKDSARKLLRLKNYATDVDLVCYALMPNHFHLLIYQRTNQIDQFMNSLCTRYGMYFNRKYKRVGVLFQDRYKAVLVKSEEQLLHLSRYIHLNPTLSSQVVLPSSLPEFLGQHHTSWIKPSHVLTYFSNSSPTTSYLDFVTSSQDESLLTNLTIDCG